MQPVNFILIDAAITGDIIERGKEINQDFVSLYRGKEEEDFENIGPYLFAFQAKSLFSSWVFDNAWGGNLGIIIETTASLEECLLHFQKYIVIKNNGGREHYFRFYDPRVLKVVLPGYDNKKLAEFFGPVEKFTLEGDNKETAVTFSQQNGILQQSLVNAAEIFGLSSEPAIKEPASVHTRIK
jgi:hypothetical protein